MGSDFRQEYISLIEKEDITEIGFLKNLDNIPTEKGGKLCLGMECLDRDLWDFDRAFPLIKKLGIHMVRLQSGWQKTEKEKGVYDFLWLDNIVDSLKAAGIETFLCLSYGNKLYCDNPEDHPYIENGGVGHFPIVTPTERMGWTNYVKAAAEHFKDRISYFEIWNEPDCRSFCGVDMPWYEAYMELVRITAPVIRKTCPLAKIISCSALFGGLKILADKGIMDYVDIHSFHSYKFFPETTAAESRANRISHIRKNYPDFQVWRGEAGCPSYNDPVSKGALSNVAVSEIKQAKFLLRHIIGDEANDAIGLTSYFHAYDFEHFSHKLRYYYGLIRHEDLSRKPSFDCLQVLTHIFDGKVKHVHDYNLSVIYHHDYKISDRKLVSMRFNAFEKNGKRFYTYHLPEEIEDAPVVYKVFLTLPCIEGQPEDYIILDPMTRKIYPVSDNFKFYAPVTDYPIFIISKSSFPEIIDICREISQKKYGEGMSQINEE